MTNPFAKPSADSEVRALIQARRKIDAIRLVRERTGLGLKEAKDVVDATEGEMGLPVRTPGSGGGLFVAEDDAPFALVLLNEPSFMRNIGDRGVRTLDDARLISDWRRAR